MIACEPPAASGHPAAWPTAPSSTPTPAVSGRSSGSTEWAARPASSARAPSVSKRRRARPTALRRPSRANRASTSGWRGRRTPAITSPIRSSACAASGLIIARQASPSRSSPAAVSSTDRSSTTVCESSGWASGAAGWIHRSPCCSRPSARNAGELTPIGWMAEHVSWRKPGSVSSAVRAPPPAVGAASNTATDRPAAAIVAAAVRPFGPDPMTTASSSATGPVSSPDSGARNRADLHDFACGNQVLGWKWRRRRLLVTTNRLEPAIATPATTGDSAPLIASGIAATL